MPASPTYSSLAELDAAVTVCQRCNRLASYIRQVGANPVRRHRGEIYWAKPVPGFGDSNARLVLVGLAPAAHGSNRTGRVFTGDLGRSWLMEALHETGFANLPTSTHPQDGLRLTDAYIVAAVRCAPPQNKPTPAEIETCRPLLQANLQLLPQRQVVIALGSIGFNSYLKAQTLPKVPFKHGALYHFENAPALISSYHPSRQNTQTGKLSWDAWIAVFKQARQLLH